MHPAVSVPAFNPSNFPIPIRRGYSRGNSNNYTTGGNSPGNFGTFGSNPTPSRRGAPSLPARQLASFNPPREGIYEATYSNTRVYELEAPNGVGVMRRKSDSWINATHILKAAGMEKSRRTKVLEREVHQGEHEKIQGGYGKYQGTWIPLYRAREVAADYGLADALHDLLDIPE
ncbi:transcription regulator HTH, apses-type DNA-binding domain-containing protein [Fimicolochytrium jonesii]|uniref:transcription regulator HTH, apses-type DNA-binding domain-containing protein n=1 Tax=Fimicolochytrium jonesii TaxID=1396493 RepID=UPI0022FF2364|nr:transcription regulator HTH, apses-type DNA-binding domain-containing protein [Fimicolochytrium jonesii]KAI8822608.1 transcription regulator HTH, apses-type DNA-binding domain-containing protein [Fimicolochytrium jonesii]